MKKYIAILIVALGTIAVQAQDYKYLNFVVNEGVGRSFDASAVSVVYRGNDAIVTASGETTAIPLDSYSYMEFSNTLLGSGSAIRGDVNGDGRVDIVDVNILINIVLGNDTPDNYDGRALVTDDDKVDIVDINAVINILLTGY